MARKECRASARAGGVPPFLQQTLKGTGREREGCCGQQHEGGRAHPFDPRHDAFHELNTTAMLLREIVQPLGLCATMRACHVLKGGCCRCCMPWWAT